MAASRLEDRVERAAEAALTAQGYVSPVELLLRLGWLAPSHLDQWRQGRVECLERVVQAGLGKQTTAMQALRTWAGRRGLRSSETRYLAQTRDRRVSMARRYPSSSVYAERCRGSRPAIAVHLSG